MPDEHRTDVDLIANLTVVPNILSIVCQSTGMGFAAVARVTETRWIACAVLDKISFGLPVGGELVVETTLCNEIRQIRQPVVIDSVSEDQAYRNHHTPAKYGFQSYISVPIVLRDGAFFGTLCAIDPLPRRLSTPETVGMFRLFADLIAFHIEAQMKLETSAADLRNERAASELREQFIAVLGHDLRNPLASIDAGIRVIERAPEKIGMVGGLVRQSVRRMSSLIDDVLDFARGRLGNGMAVASEPADLAMTLRAVVDEQRMSLPDRILETDIDLPDPIRCDRTRIAQLASNLLGNAMSYGDPGLPVRLDARVEGDSVVISIANGGAPISPDALPSLFQPFFRHTARENKQGLGLGLYISSQIASAHNGALSVSSTVDETRFTFRMPLRA